MSGSDFFVEFRSVILPFAVDFERGSCVSRVRGMHRTRVICACTCQTGRYFQHPFATFRKGLSALYGVHACAHGWILKFVCVLCTGCSQPRPNVIKRWHPLAKLRTESGQCIYKTCCNHLQLLLHDLEIRLNLLDRE